MKQIGHSDSFGALRSSVPRTRGAIFCCASESARGESSDSRVTRHRSEPGRSPVSRACARRCRPTGTIRTALRGRQRTISPTRAERAGGARRARESARGVADLGARATRRSASCISLARAESSWSRALNWAAPIYSPSKLVLRASRPAARVDFRRASREDPLVRVRSNAPRGVRRRSAAREESRAPRDSARRWSSLFAPRAKRLRRCAGLNLCIGGVALTKPVSAIPWGRCWTSPSPRRRRTPTRRTSAAMACRRCKGDALRWRTRTLRRLD